MFWTLQEESFRCFERTHGARPIQYSDWFYCKLIQFLEFLGYEHLVLTWGPLDGPLKPTTDRPWEEGFYVIRAEGMDLQEEDVQAAFRPEDNDRALWGQIVAEVCSVSENRGAVLEGILARRRGGKGTRKRWEWGRTQKRNECVRRLLEQGKDPVTICRELDQRRVEPLPAMRRAGVESWVAAWNDKYLRRSIQSLFSKLRSRSRPVKQ
jgi:hypothetical protein